MQEEQKPKKGFALMDKDKQREIARKGGQKHSSEHMSMIGRIGGKVKKTNKPKSNVETTDQTQNQG